MRVFLFIIKVMKIQLKEKQMRKITHKQLRHTHSKEKLYKSVREAVVSSGGVRHS